MLGRVLINRQPNADLNALPDVRYWTKSGHGADLSVCPLMTQSGHCHGHHAASDAIEPRRLIIAAGKKALTGEVAPARHFFEMGFMGSTP